MIPHSHVIRRFHSISEPEKAAHYLEEELCEALGRGKGGISSFYLRAFAIYRVIHRLKVGTQGIGHFNAPSVRGHRPLDKA